MLPEHKERLAAWYKEQEYEAKPELDDQKREEINRILMEAIEENDEIEVTYYKDHHLHKETGHIRKCDLARQVIQIVGHSECIIQVSMSDIVNAESS